MNEFVFKRDKVYTIITCSWYSVVTGQLCNLVVYYDNGWKISTAKNDESIKVHTNDLIKHMINDISSDQTNGAYYNVYSDIDDEWSDIMEITEELESSLSEVLLKILNTIKSESYDSVKFE